MKKCFCIFLLGMLITIALEANGGNILNDVDLLFIPYYECVRCGRIEFNLYE